MSEKRWKVAYLCCGREMFTSDYDTWEQADQHRRWWEDSEHDPTNGHTDRRGIITENAAAPSPSAAHAEICDAETALNVIRVTLSIDDPPTTLADIVQRIQALRAASPSPAAVEAGPSPGAVKADAKTEDDWLAEIAGIENERGLEIEDLQAHLRVDVETAFRAGYLEGHSEKPFSDYSEDRETMRWQEFAARRGAAGGQDG